MLSPALERAARFADRVAMPVPDGAVRYRDLLAEAFDLASALLRARGVADLGGAPVVVAVEPSPRFVAAVWGVWAAGGAALPLHGSASGPEIEHVLAESAAELAVAEPPGFDRLEPALTARGGIVLGPGASATPVPLPRVDPERPALVVFTSGTTAAAKGVVLAHRALRTQCEVLSDAWRWRADDHALLVLPLHHVHGLVNVLCCALWNGARCTALPRFSPEAAWERLLVGDVDVLMAVPTIHARLLDALEAAAPDRQAAMRAALTRLRLAVSGSAALPVPLFERWHALAGTPLLERYGMTEIGMALSNPLDARVAGSVGVPLPTVEVRLRGEGGLLDDEVDGEGELEVRGPSLFSGYLGRPEATAATTTPDRWFRTGDVAAREHGHYRILGRASVDILKSGGYKLSALEIEHALAAHPAIAACAVVGVPDPDLGERVCACVELHPAGELTLEQLRAWAADRLSAYKLPRRLWLGPLPRTALGKVEKRELVRRLSAEADQAGSAHTPTSSYPGGAMPSAK